MTVQELSRDQLQELKCSYYTEKYDDELSYGEIVNIDNIVSDKEVFDVYDATDFSNDDFFCSADEDEYKNEECLDELDIGNSYSFICSKKIDEVHEGQFCYLFDDIANFVSFIKDKREGFVADCVLFKKWGISEGICTAIEHDTNGDLLFSAGDIVSKRHAFLADIESFFETIEYICTCTKFSFSTNLQIKDKNNYDIFDDSSTFDFTYKDSFNGEFIIELRKGNLEYLLEQLESFYEDYDPDYETYLWLDETGHGKSGAPYRMGDILKSMEDRKTHLAFLIRDFKDYIG